MKTRPTLFIIGALYFCIINILGGCNFGSQKIIDDELINVINGFVKNNKDEIQKNGFELTEIFPQSQEAQLSDKNWRLGNWIFEINNEDITAYIGKQYKGAASSRVIVKIIKSGDSYRITKWFIEDAWE
jgi:hypothetical protein